MSAPTAAGVLRELGATPRTFTSVKRAVLWYRKQLDAKLRVNRDLADAGTPRNAETAEVSVATFAAIAPCLKREHPTDARAWCEAKSLPGGGYWRDRDEDEVADIRGHVSGERQLWLVAWYEGDGWGDETFLAEKWEERERRLAMLAGRDGDAVRVSQELVRRRCLQTERVLRVRMDYAHLLRED